MSRNTKKPMKNTNIVLNRKLNLIMIVSVRKKYDTAVATSTGSNSEITSKNTLHVNNVRHTVSCKNCQKKKTIFSWKPEGNSWYRCIHDLRSVLGDTSYEYHCCGILFGIRKDELIHPISTIIFYVKTALLGSMEIESLYYQAKNTILSVQSEKSFLF